MILQLIRKSSFVKRLYLRLGQFWVHRKLQTVLPCIQGTIVDIGSGNGMVAYYLKQRHHEVTAVDVDNLSIIDEIETVVYDGIQLPFSAQSFDTALLLTVLHHTTNPTEVLRETARVAQRIIIIEDIYTNPIQQYLTYIMDTIVNFGHSSMTYQNKNDQGWKATFEEVGLSIIAEEQRRVLLFFRQATYTLTHSGRGK